MKIKEEKNIFNHLLNSLIAAKSKIGRYIVSHSNVTYQIRIAVKLPATSIFAIWFSPFFVYFQFGIICSVIQLNVFRRKKWNEIATPRANNVWTHRKNAYQFNEKKFMNSRRKGEEIFMRCLKHGNFKVR